MISRLSSWSEKSGFPGKYSPLDYLQISMAIWVIRPMWLDGGYKVRVRDLVKLWKELSWWWVLWYLVIRKVKYVFCHMIFEVDELFSRNNQSNTQISSKCFIHTNQTFPKNYILLNWPWNKTQVQNKEKRMKVLTIWDKLRFQYSCLWITKHQSDGKMHTYVLAYILFNGFEWIWIQRPNFRLIYTWFRYTYFYFRLSMDLNTKAVHLKEVGANSVRWVWTILTERLAEPVPVILDHL